MSRFRTASSRPTHLKAAFTGFQGSGKTMTAVLMAIGMVQHMRKLKLPDGDKPVFMIDTERGNLWIADLFQKAGIELMVDETMAFADLKADMRDAINNSSLLLIDSITAFWREFCEAYRQEKKRKFGLTFPDWAYLKEEWREGFTQPFLNSDLHIIFCGRAGYEYEHFTDESGRKQIEKAGIKMKAEGELGFEPNLVVHMEREQDLESDRGKVWHVAHIMKDRRPDGQTLDGKTFRNPTYRTFKPHIDYLDIGGTASKIDESRKSNGMIPGDETTNERTVTHRKIAIDEIKALIVDHFPGQTKEEKAAKSQLIKKHFGTPSWTSIEKTTPLSDLRIGYNNMHLELTGQPSRYGGPAGDRIDDEIPIFGSDGERTEA